MHEILDPHAELDTAIRRAGFGHWAHEAGDPLLIIELIEDELEKTAAQ